MTFAWVFDSKNVFFDQNKKTKNWCSY